MQRTPPNRQLQQLTNQSNLVMIITIRDKMQQHTPGHRDDLLVRASNLPRSAVHWGTAGLPIYIVGAVPQISYWCLRRIRVCSFFASPLRERRQEGSYARSKPKMTLLVVTIYLLLFGLIGSPQPILTLSLTTTTTPRLP